MAEGDGGWHEQLRGTFLSSSSVRLHDRELLLWLGNEQQAANLEGSTTEAMDLHEKGFVATLQGCRDMVVRKLREASSVPGCSILQRQELR